MQDTSESENDRKDILIADLTVQNKNLMEQNEILSRLVLDLQETVKLLQDEINRLKGQKSRPKFPPANLNNGN